MTAVNDSRTAKRVSEAAKRFEETELSNALEPDCMTRDTEFILSLSLASPINGFTKLRAEENQRNTK